VRGGFGRLCRRRAEAGGSEVIVDRSGAARLAREDGEGANLFGGAYDTPGQQMAVVMVRDGNLKGLATFRYRRFRLP